jgi:glycosyltransferase involved in cell wall biosynthesis
MPAGKYTFIIEQGTTHEFTIVKKDSNGDAVDLTGYTARMQIRPDFADLTTTVYTTISSSIAGDGTANFQAKKIIRDSGLEDKVTFTGWIFGEKLNDVFKKCQILVLPSWSEGLPNAMIESMAAKLAVVVTNVGNIPDLLTNKKQALIVPKKNIESLTIAIESLILEKELFHSIAEEGYHFVKEHYSVEPAVNLLSKVINNAISKHNNE